MKKIILLSVILVLSVSSSFAYKFLGPKWPGSNPVVTYYINEKGCEELTNETEDLIKSFKVWEVPTTAISSEYKGPTSISTVAADKKNTLMWATGSDWTLDKQVIAACYSWYQGSTLVDFDIVFNGRDYKWSTNGEYEKMDVGHISTHEVGHALGLDHSDVPHSVMWPKARFGDVAHRDLSADDSIGITMLYPRTIANNRAPVFTSKPVTEAITGLKYTYKAVAEDPDGDTVRYSLMTKPLNMTIDSISGVITWYPKFLDIGPASVIVACKDKMNAVGKQAFVINVSDLVVYTEDNTAKAGDTIYQNVKVTPMDDYGIVAGNIVLSYKPAEVTILAVDTIGSVLSGVTLVKNITEDSVKVAFADSKPFSGTGILFRIKLLVAQEFCGTPVHVAVRKAIFNDGKPAANIRNGTIYTICGPATAKSIDGKVVYTASNAGVSGAKITLIEMQAVRTTNNDGYFGFDAVPKSSTMYTLTASKDSGDIRNAVSAYDAALILRYVVGLHGLDTYGNQKKAADVNGNSMLTAYDAALILRFIVGENDLTKIGVWEIMPSKKEISNLLESAHNQNFDAYMIGDVSGNWNDTQSGGSKKSKSMETSVSLQSFGDNQIVVDKKTQRIITMNIALNKKGTDLYSGEFSVVFDTSKYRFHAVKPLALLNDFISASHAKNNIIKIAFAGADTIQSVGNLFEIQLVPKDPLMTIDSSGTKTAINFSRFNELASDLVKIESGRSARNFNSNAMTQIVSIASNPFKGRVSMEYVIAEKQNVSIIIYDLQGKEVKKLANGIHANGTYHITWDWRGANGQMIGAAYYIVRFTGKDFCKSVKLFRMK
jgi:hypothetical protein